MNWPAACGKATISVLHSHSNDECPVCGSWSGWDGCQVPRVAHNRSPALASLYDGTLTGKREQEILTPDWILEALRKEWRDIALDPCSDAALSTGATGAYVEGQADGLSCSWLDKTYANPPYGTLKDWLAKASAEATYRGKRIAMLCPVRTHRVWYREALDGTQTAIELPGVVFKGYKAAFPAPLHLLCWNWTPDPKLWRGTVRRYVKVA